MRHRTAIVAAVLLVAPLLVGIGDAAAARPAAEQPSADGLAATPPMGWNDWNRFGCDINEDIVKQTADAMVRTGLAADGYKYVNVDDCWEAASRDADGNLTNDPQKFPSGMKALADYVHSKGLKFGIYTGAGDYTCQHRPGGGDVADPDEQRHDQGDGRKDGGAVAHARFLPERAPPCTTIATDFNRFEQAGSLEWRALASESVRYLV
jgi:alpha-galactosidase